jgi:hypothetical protein
MRTFEHLVFDGTPHPEHLLAPRLLCRCCLCLGLLLLLLRKR